MSIFIVPLRYSACSHSNSWLFRVNVEILSLNLVSNATTCPLSFCYAIFRVRCKFPRGRSCDGSTYISYLINSSVDQICTIELVAPEKAYCIGMPITVPTTISKTTVSYDSIGRMLKRCLHGLSHGHDQFLDFDCRKVNLQTLHLGSRLFNISAPEKQDPYWWPLHRQYESSWR